MALRQLMSDDHEPDRRPGSGGDDWLERHLGKIVGVVLLLCLLGIAARAMTG